MQKIPLLLLGLKLKLSVLQKTKMTPNWNIMYYFKGKKTSCLHNFTSCHHILFVPDMREKFLFHGQSSKSGQEQKNCVQIRI